MARLLAIDWDHDQLHIVAVGTSRKGVVAEKALAFALDGELTPASGEGLGRKLRDALKAAGIAPAPIVACVGRERVVVKELRYPPVSASEEPALVRFQAAKELSDLPDDLVIDYAPLSAPDQPGERQALAVAIRKSAALAWQALARGLGVKLLALTSRAQALIGTVSRMQADGRGPAGDTVAIVTVGGRWAELAVLHQDRMLFARSLAVGPALAGEVKRSLNLFGSSSFAATPSVLLLSGIVNAELEQSLQASAGLPVQRLDPFVKADAVAETSRPMLAAALGAAHLWARTETLPINFAAPKQPRAAADPDKRQRVFLSGAAAVLVAAGVLFAMVFLAAKRSRTVELVAEKTQLEDRYKKLAQDRLDIDALKEWEQTSVSWLDEVYDLAARFPHQIGFRVKEFAVFPIAKRNAKDNFVAQISISGVGKTSQDALVNQFLDSLNADKHLKATISRSKDIAGGNQDFQIKIDVAHQPAEKYTARFTAIKQRVVEMEEPTDDSVEEGGAP